MRKTEKRKQGRGGRGYAFLAAALAGGILWGSPVWEEVSGDTGRENRAVMEGAMATPCNPEKKKDMEFGEEQAGELYVSATEVILPEPYRKGYTFMEWNREPDGSGECYMASDVIEITEMTLYAVWEKDEREGVTSMETATVSNAKRATASNWERVETEWVKGRSGEGQGTEPEEETDRKVD